jgi:hypothetical protein
MPDLPIPEPKFSGKNLSEFPVLFEIAGYSVGEWTAERDGKGKPEAVALSFDLGRALDGVTFLIRLKSKAEADRLILLLAQYRDMVWPIAPSPPREGLASGGAPPADALRERALLAYALREGHEDCAALGVEARKECYGCDANWRRYLELGGPDATRGPRTPIAVALWVDRERASVLRAVRALIEGSGATDAHADLALALDRLVEAAGGRKR